MFKKLLTCALCVCTLYACKKSDSDKCTTVIGYPTTTEVSNLKSYLTANSITATEDSRGFFYNVTFPGTGSEYPALTDSVTVRYIGKLTNGTVFDSTASGETRKFPLGNLIFGWQYGLPLVKRGGIVDLYLPPALGYGCNAYPKLPSNSNTVFHVELVDF